MTRVNYVFSLDIIRVLAIFGVVSIHIVNAVYTRPDFFGGTTWWITIIIDSISRVSIPLFIMISGYLILSKNERFTASLNRMFTRILVPLIFWTGFFIWYGGGFPSFAHFHADWIEKIFAGNLYHLYFLVIIVGLYFMAPLLRAFLYSVDRATQKHFMQILILLSIVLVAGQYLLNACGTENFFTRWIPYAGLFVGGYFLGTNNEKFNKKVIFGFLFAGILLTLSGNYFQYYNFSNGVDILGSVGCLSHYTDHYISGNVILMSICAFILLFNMKYENLTKNKYITSAVKSIAAASFGIYIIHPFVARFLEVHFQLAVDFSTLPMPLIITLRLILVFLISYLIAFLIIKTPIIKALLGVKAK